MVAYLEENELGDAYKDACSYTRQFTIKFDELERLADNRVRADLPPHYPKVNDGSLSALIGEVPMRIWAQLQTGRVVPLRDGNDKLDAYKVELANIAWSNKIVPNANTQAPFFSKLQTAEEDSFTYGSQYFYSFAVSRNGMSGADFIVCKPRDIKFEPGKVSDLDSDYMFLDTYYTKLKIRGMRDSAVAEDKLAKKQDRKSENKWVIAVLDEILNGDHFAVEKDSEDQSTEEGKRQSFSKTIKFVTCFHRGYKAPFYTFVPALKNKTVRTMHNINRSGDIPLSSIYYKRNLKDPYGKGQVEGAAPTQNSLDFLMAGHILGAQQGNEPPVAVKGDISKAKLETIEYSPNARWILGDATAEIQKTTSEVYTQFPNDYGLLKTQLMNHLGTGDNSVSSTAGNPQYSKTPVGVSAQEERKNAKDNYLRQRVDESLVALAKNLINIYFANMHGSEYIDISDEQRDRLVKAGMDIPEDASSVLISYEELRDNAWDYDIDANSSMVKNDNETKDRLVEMANIVSTNPNLEQQFKSEGKNFKVAEMYKQMFVKSGLDDWDKIIVDMTPEEITQFEAEKAAALQSAQPLLPASDVTNNDVSASQAIEQPAANQSQIDIEQPTQELPTESTDTQAVDPNAIAELQELLQMGFDESTAHLIMVLRRSGWNDEQITEHLSKENQAVQPDEQEQLA